MSEENKSVYSDKEEGILDKIQKDRMSIIAELNKEGVTDDLKQLEALNSTMSSVTKDIHTKANLRLKKKDSESKGELSAAAAALLKEVSFTTTPPKARDIVIESVTTDLTVVDGHTDINPEPLTPSDFLDNLDDK